MLPSFHQRSMTIAPIYDDSARASIVMHEKRHTDADFVNDAATTDHVGYGMHSRSLAAHGSALLRRETFHPSTLRQINPVLTYTTGEYEYTHLDASQVVY